MPDPKNMTCEEFQAQMAELRSLVLEGPDLERNGVVRWRCADLRAEIAARWSVTVTEGTVGKLLHRLRMTRLQPRPYHPKKDAAAQETFNRLRKFGFTDRHRYDSMGRVN